ncbi:MAG: hypothetical protein H7123_05125 [Thermoleophilia bacterium]|nr:hypothetical protein [Thermoleophilia bacterium]
MSRRDLDKIYPESRYPGKRRRHSVSSKHAYGKLIRFTSFLLIGIGASLIWKTFRMSGSDFLQLGYLLGAGMLAAGVVRLTLQRRLEATDHDAADDTQRDGNDS